MNLLIRFFYCILLAGLVACVPKHGLRGQELALCQATCAQHFDFCSHNCTDSCPICSWKGQQKAAYNYNKYVKERTVEGKKVMRELNSYRDPLQCRKVTCNCMADLSLCKQGCSGIIRKRLQAVPNCV